MTDKCTTDNGVRAPTPDEVWNSLEEITITVRHMADGLHKLTCPNRIFEPRPDDPEDGLTNILACPTCGYLQGMDQGRFVATTGFNTDTFSHLLMLAASSAYCHMPVALVFDTGKVAVFAAGRKDDDMEQPPAE